MLSLSRSVLSLALLLPACAAHEGPTDPPTPAARVEVKVASVQLVQNCDDPPTDAAAETALASAASPPPAQQVGQAPLAAMPPEPGAMGKVSAGAALHDAPGGWSPPCTQSTMQLSIANLGDREGKLRIDSVRLFDARSNKELGKIQARKPGQWNPIGAYQPWNEVIGAGATVKIGYRLGEPDWAAIPTIPGTDTDPYTRPYVLEIDISVDGVSQTVRSPEFVREPVHVIVT